MAAVIAAAERNDAAVFQQLPSVDEATIVQLQCLSGPRLRTFLVALGNLWGRALMEPDGPWHRGDPDRLLGYAALYFDICLRELRARATRPSASANAVDDLFWRTEEPLFRSAAQWATSVEGEPSGTRARLSSLYTATVMHAQFLPWMRATLPTSLLFEIERGLHGHLAELVDSVSKIALGTPVHRFGTVLTSLATQQISAAYAMPLKVSERRVPGRDLLDSLPALASRTEEATRTFGLKQIETLFAQQLALMAQALGFLVVPAKVGERQGDVICISNHPYTRGVFLLEAKTSRKPYALPVDDQRALHEYVKTLRATTYHLGDLQFVLLVGPVAAVRLEARLKALEATCRVPVRYCPIEHLVRFRAGWVGPVDAGRFIGAILRGDHILSSRTFVDLDAELRAEASALDAFVRTALIGRLPGL